MTTYYHVMYGTTDYPTQHIGWYPDFQSAKDVALANVKKRHLEYEDYLSHIQDPKQVLTIHYHITIERILSQSEGPFSIRLPFDMSLTIVEVSHD